MKTHLVMFLQDKILYVCWTCSLCTRGENLIKCQESKKCQHLEDADGEDVRAKKK